MTLTKTSVVWSNESEFREQLIYCDTVLALWFASFWRDINIGTLFLIYLISSKGDCNFNRIAVYYLAVKVKTGFYTWINKFSDNLYRVSWFLHIKGRCSPKHITNWLLHNYVTMNTLPQYSFIYSSKVSTSKILLPYAHACNACRKIWCH